MKSILVTVVIPVHNVENYLGECLRSITLQTYKDIEIIVIDDGSLDSSGLIADNFAKKDRRIKVIHKKNEGVSKTKNLGIEKARGEFIAFIDADDYIRKDFINNLLNDLSAHNVHIATTGTDYSEMRKDENNTVEVFNKETALKKMFYGTLEKSSNGIQLFEKKLLIENKIEFDPKKKIGEDFDFLVKALICTDKIAVDYRRMYFYRPNPSSAMHQKINEGLMKAADNFTSIGKQLVKKYPGLQQAIDSKKFNDSVSLAMRGYHARSEWRKDFDKLEYDIKSLKWQVLNDKNARRIVRLAALVYCLLGFDTGTYILRRIKK